MRMLFALARLAAFVAIAAAVIATFFDTASRVAINPFNFFGYFTLQSNIVSGILFLLAALAGLRGRRQSPALQVGRAGATTYLIIVGIVYNTLLTGTEGGGGVALPWANSVLHVIIPIYAVVDWVFFGDRSRIPMKRLWVILGYPILWLIVVLFRGATDGWVPYPFLNPANGYLSVTVVCLGIAVGFALFGWLVLLYSRVKLLKP